MQVNRFLKKMSAIDKNRGRMTGSELRAIRAYTARDLADLFPFDIGVADGTSFKSKVAHPVHQKPFHPEVESVIDAVTRYLCGWSAGLAESGQIVADALRHAATVAEGKPVGGVFAILYTDLGAGNMSKMMHDDLTGQCARLHTTHEVGRPGNPEGRGLVERIQGSIWIRAAKELPTYNGKDMDPLALRRTMKIVNADIKAKGISNHLLSWGQFIEFLGRHAEAYNNRPHSALPKIADPQTGLRRHMTPHERMMQFIDQGWRPETISPAELQDLFKPWMKVKTNRGLVNLWGNQYFSKELEHFHGEFVIVEYDVHDPKLVWVRNLKRQMICIAGFEANKRKYFAQSAIEKAREDRGKRRLKLLDEKREEVKLEAFGVIDCKTSIPDECINSSAATLEVLQNDGLYQETEAARPRFADNIDRYEWHLENGETTEEDMAWCAWFRTTSDYEALYE